MFKCLFCEKEFSTNAGKGVHQKQCKSNPSRISFQLGRKAWNAGLSKASDKRLALQAEKQSASLKERYRNGKKPGNWNPLRESLKQYRTDCSFKFSVYDFPEEFNLNLIDKYGWYKAKNRGNNQSGVSRDHMVSVKYGWENKIPSEIISHPANCDLLCHGDNVRKYSTNSITLDELLIRIKEWNEKYKVN